MEKEASEPDPPEARAPGIHNGPEEEEEADMARWVKMLMPSLLLTAATQNDLNYIYATARGGLHAKKTRICLPSLKYIYAMPHTHEQKSCPSGCEITLAPCCLEATP